MKREVLKFGFEGRGRVSSADFTMLHNVKLTEPSLIEWITCRVNDMAKSILLCDYKHRVKDTFHRLCRLD